MPDILKVMTYNIRGGTFNALGLEGIARVIERYQPDIVGLQEINVNRYVTGPVDQPRWLADRLGMESVFGASIEFDEKSFESLKGYYGNALLSRFPVRTSEVHLLPKPKATDEQRTVLSVSLQMPNRILNTFVTHWGLDAAQRAAQAVATVSLIQSWQSGSPLILMGDFNATPDSPEITTIRNVLDDTFQLRSIPDEQRISFPSGRSGNVTPDGWMGAIDYIFVSAGFTVEQIEVVYDENRASDHNPVVASIWL